MRTHWRRAAILWMAAAAMMAGGARRLSAGDALAAGRERGREPYRIFLRVTRTSDHAPLLSASVGVRLGPRTRATLPVAQPGVDQPAFSAVTVALSRNANPGEYELVTVLAVRQVRRNRKGQIKRERRNLGSLLPIRLGETQVATPPDDPITLEVRAERE